MSDKFIGQTLADKYKIEEVLREGDSGKIYRGTHLSMEKPVTVKILSPILASDEKVVKQFSSEARTISRITHPNILNVTDFGSDKNGAVYLVLEDSTGETLKDALAREGKFTVGRAVKIAVQTAIALSAVHTSSLIHGHLSSENILLKDTAGEFESVKVMDIGAVSAEENNLSVDPASAVSAKNLNYSSPEQNASNAEIDERSDIYSLGVILYEMLAGEVPFVAETSAELIKKQAENPPLPLSAFRTDLPANLETVVLRALARNPEMRYQTASELARDLNNVSSGNFNEQVVNIPQYTKPIENTNNNLWKTAFVVLAGISLLAIGMIYATSVKQTDPSTQLQTDANGQPVQPLNPATGMNEQGMANMMPYPVPQTGGVMGDANTVLQQSMPNGDGFGDGYNPWARGGAPPSGAPPQQFIPPGGQMIDPNNPNSIFMQDSNGVIYQQIPIPANSNINANVQSPAPTATPKGGKPPANANTQPTPVPAGTPKTAPETKPTPAAVAPKTEKTPAAKPPEKPKTTPPASSEKRNESGQQ